jgi:hypothetical protein
MSLQGDASNEVEFDIDAAISGWLTLLCDILELGYFPTTKVHTGNCLQLQNVVTDGGFCDIDSVEPMNRVTGTFDFFDALLTAVSLLQETITSVMLEGNEKVLGNLSWVAVWQEVAAQLRQRRANNAALDPRLEQFLETSGMNLLRLATNTVSDERERPVES